MFPSMLDTILVNLSVSAFMHLFRDELFLYFFSLSNDKRNGSRQTIECSNEMPFDRFSDWVGYLLSA